MFLLLLVSVYLSDVHMMFQLDCWFALMLVHCSEADECALETCSCRNSE